MLAVTGMGTFSKVCIKETAGPGPGICRREPQQAEMRGQAEMDPMEIPKLRLGSEVLVGLSRDLSTSRGLSELVRKVPGKPEL